MEQTTAKQKTTIVRDFTEGPIGSQLIRFAVPFMISNAFQVFYSLVDMIIVGKVVGSAGLSAVSTAGNFFNFIVMLCIGFSTGGQVYISQLIGAGKREKLNRAIGTLFTSVMGIGAVMTVAGLLLRRVVLTWMNTPEAAFTMAVQYTLVCSLGVLFTYGYNMVSAVLRGMGDSRHPFLFIAIASFINVVLDLLFIAGFGWGAWGAALATVIGQAVSFLTALVFLFRRKEQFGFDFRLSSLRIEKQTLSILCSMGVPFALQGCAINISMMFVSSLVNGLGVNASAVFGSGVRLDDIVNKITQGITYAVSAMVGQNIAAGKFKRVRKAVFYGWGFSAVAYLIFALCYFIFTRQMFGIFTDDAAVLDLAPVFVRGIVWTFPAMVLMRGTSGLIQGIGNARLGLVLAILDGFVMRIALSYLIGVVMGQGLYGFVLGYGLAAFGTSLPGVLYFATGKWQKRKLKL